MMMEVVVVVVVVVVMMTTTTMMMITIHPPNGSITNLAISRAIGLKTVDEFGYCQKQRTEINQFKPIIFSFIFKKIIIRN